MDIIYQPHIDDIDREIESLFERIHPPRVCIDNDSCRDCTVVKIDSANRHGILLEMVQALTDLDLVISKSYISSDGGWLMDVFHVTDQVGNKLTDKNLMHYIQQALNEARCSKEISREIELHSNNSKRQEQDASPSNIALEVTGTDRPGLFSEISAALVDLGLNVTSATAWTHNDRVACIIYLEDASRPEPINDPIRLAHVQDQVNSVVEAHDSRGSEGERRSVRLATCFAASRNHTERRLHQLMYADRDYERCPARHVNGDGDEKRRCDGTHVSVGRCEEKGYWVVNVRSRDRPKLLFDTVCVLTDMQYNVFHAAVSSKGSMADQEYYVRHKDSSSLDKESERQKLCLCLIAAVERRVSHVCPTAPSTKGREHHTRNENFHPKHIAKAVNLDRDALVQELKVEIRTQNRRGLLSNVTRVIRENGLSITKVHIEEQGEGKVVVGSFHVTDSSGEDVNPNIAELVRRETGGSVVAVHDSPYSIVPQSPANESNTSKVGSRFSLGSMLWSQLERLRLSNNSGPMRS